MLKSQKLFLEEVFRMVYAFIEISDLEVMLNTWSSTLIPPKPKIKLAKVTKVENDFVLICERLFKPFVSSTNPQIIGFIKFTSMFRVLNIG